MEFSSPEYWSGQPFASPGDFPNPGIQLRSPALQADSLPVEPQGKSKNTGEFYKIIVYGRVGLHVFKPQKGKFSGVVLL